MPGKNRAKLFSTFLFLVSHGVVAATTAAAFFNASFLLLTHPWQDTRDTSLQPSAARANQTAAITATANPSAPPDAVAATTNLSAPPDAVAATTNLSAPPDAVAATANQTAVPRPVMLHYRVSPATVALSSSPRLVAAFAQAAGRKGITLEQYRDARLRFLRQQQAELELQMAAPNLSAAETSRFERQKAYWDRAIAETMALH